VWDRPRPWNRPRKQPRPARPRPNKFRWNCAFERSSPPAKPSRPQRRLGRLGIEPRLDRVNETVECQRSVEALLVDEERRRAVDSAAHAAASLVADLRRVFSRVRSEEHTSELQSLTNLVCRL